MGDQRRTIRVIDGDGAPVADAFVAVESSSVPFPEISLITDKDGTLGVVFPAGRYRIGARGTDGGYSAIETEIVEGGESELVITLQSAEEQ